MGEHDAEAAAAKLGGCGVEVLADGAEGRLEQDPAPTGRALREGLELVLTQAPDHLVPDLATTQHLQVDPGRRDRRADGPNQVGEVEDGGHVVVPYVRRGDHGARAVGGGGPPQLDALRDVGGPVVHAREDVEVNVRRRHRRMSFGTRSRHKVTPV
jgi:hypothetical protein